MGSNLHKNKTKKKVIKLGDGQTVGGKGRLLKVVIDKLQNYYGTEIRQNVGNHRTTAPKDLTHGANISLMLQIAPIFIHQTTAFPIFRKELKPLFIRLLLKWYLKGLHKIRTRH